MIIIIMIIMIIIISIIIIIILLMILIFVYLFIIFKTIIQKSHPSFFIFIFSSMFSVTVPSPVSSQGPVTTAAGYNTIQLATSLGTGQTEAGAESSNMLALAVCLSVLLSGCHAGMLYPREAEFRQLQELNGFWDFRADNSSGRNTGFDERWFAAPLVKVP